jgi:hypothetical protein
MEQDKNINHDPHFTTWKRHTLAGNLYFEKHQIVRSIEHYEIAICEAIMLINMVNSGRAAVAALLASFHNLAELYAQQNEHDLSESELAKAHNIINALLLNEQSDEQEEALIWGKCRANIALLKFRHLRHNSIPQNNHCEINSSSTKQSNQSLLQKLYSSFKDNKEQL